MVLLKCCALSSSPRFFLMASRWSALPSRRNKLVSCVLISLWLFLWQGQASFARENRLLPSLGTQLTVVSSGVVLIDEVFRKDGGYEHLCLIDIDLDDPHVRLRVVQAYDHLASGDEPLSSMANRTKALAGINGDYFEIGGPGRPIGMLISNGQLLQTPTNDSYYAVLGVTALNRLTMGPEFFSGSILVGEASYPLHEINIYSDIHKGPILITPDLGTGLPVLGDVVVLLRPVPNDPSAFLVESVRSGETWLPALSQQYALLAKGGDGVWLSDHVHPNDTLRVTEHITPDGNLLQALGGGPVVLKDGLFYHDTHLPVPGGVFVRNPITAIGTNQDGTHALLAVFDGRGAGPWKSVGMTHYEAALSLQAHGAYNAMLFDTGGSSELVTRLPGHESVSIINFPSGGKERPVANGLFVSEAPAPPPLKLCRVVHFPFKQGFSSLGFSRKQKPNACPQIP
jgi:exopolysaccharide biosynthesis protein